MPATTISTTTTIAAALVRDTTELDTEAQALVDRLAEVRDLITALDKEKKALTEAILTVVGDAEAGTVGGRVRVEVARRTRHGVDAKMLAEVAPEIHELVATTTDYTVLVVK